MATIDKFSRLALAFPEAQEAPHFEKTSFRVGGKIFATVNAPAKTATVKLSLADQDIFCLADKAAVYAVPNKWGKQGWTIVELSKIKMSLLRQVLESAYCSVAPAKLVRLVKDE